MQTRANNHLFSIIITMQPLTPEKVNHILLLLDLSHSAYSISYQTHISPNTICNMHKKRHPNLQKSTEGCTKILSPTVLICAIVLNFLPLAKLIQTLSCPTTFRKLREDLSLHKQYTMASNK